MFYNKIVIHFYFMWVTKTTGERQEFNPEKIFRTAIRAGASQTLAQKISALVSEKIREGTSTREIMGWILKFLDKNEPLVASRYSLKDAIMSLGPTGFTFELYIEKLLTFEKYQVSLPDILTGACVTHEVDLVIKKDSLCWMGECKFHNRLGLYSGIKDALYTYARFLDLVEGHLNGLNPIEFNFPWLICNTQFSADVITYASHKRMRLLAWKYPEDSGLREIIEKNKFYPITALRQWPLEARDKALRAGLITCKDLIATDKDKISYLTGLNRSKVEALWQEAWNLSNFSQS